ncbi:MAG: hypothetical protein LBL36_07915 [Clostridiales Family XIII bacterium]|jgi:hypothetical protein|nr:hypothetical protein [Clostridiales Family XIII bacterium]
MKQNNPAKALRAFKVGFIKGLTTGGRLLCVMLPIYLVVVFLTYTPVIAFLQERLAPVMRVFSLPGDAAIPIVTGFFSDEYGVVAAMSGFNFGAAQITTIAMIILCFHSIPLEAAVGRQIGFNPAKYTVYRFVMAIVTGVLVGWLTGLLYGGADSLPTALAPSGSAAETLSVFAWAPGDPGANPWIVMGSEMLRGSLSVVLSLARVIVPLMIVIEFLLAYKLVERFTAKLGWLRRILGISKDALLPLLIGLLMGVTYGAGTLMEINKRTPLSTRDFTLIGVFLYACHGIIETSILFAVAGGNVFFICIVRLAIALLVTFVAARLPRFAK